MGSIFFMGDIDLTPFIPVPTYKVNQFDVYEEWTDANHKKHREIVRTQIKGTFTLLFRTPAEFDFFMNSYQTLKKQDGTVPVHATTVNATSLAMTPVYVYMDFDPANTKPFMGAKSYEGFEVTIEEP